MDVAELTELVRTRVAGRTGFPHSVRFDFPEHGAIHIDGGTDPIAVSNAGTAADLTVRVKIEDFRKILDKALKPQVAVMTGRLRLGGNPGLALKLGALLD